MINWIKATDKPKVSNKQYLCFHNGQYVVAEFTDTIYYVVNYDNMMMDCKSIDPSWVYGGTHIIEPSHYIELSKPSDDDVFLSSLFNF